MILKMIVRRSAKYISPLMCIYALLACKPGSLAGGSDEASGPSDSNEASALKLVPGNLPQTSPSVSPLMSDGAVYRIIPQLNSSYLWLLGDFSGGILRVDSSGKADSNFVSGLNGGANGAIFASLVQADGQVVLGGAFTSFAQKTVGRIVRVTPAGQIDQEFLTNVGAGFNRSVKSLALLEDGRILVGGEFSDFNGVRVDFLVRLNKDGTLDPSYGLAPASEPSPAPSVLAELAGSASTAEEPAREAASAVDPEVAAAEALAAEKLAAEKLAAEKLAAEKLAAEKLAAEKLAAEKLAAEKLAAEQLAAEQALADKKAAKASTKAEKFAAKKAELEKFLAEKAEKRATRKAEKDAAKAAKKAKDDEVATKKTK